MLLFGWIGTGGTSFLLGGIWRKGGRTLAHDGGKRTLPQMKSPILLSWPPHSQSQQSYITAHVAKLIVIIGAAKKVLTPEKKLGTKDWLKRFNLSVFAMGVVDVWLAYQGITGTAETQADF